MTKYIISSVQQTSSALNMGPHQSGINSNQHQQNFVEKMLIGLDHAPPGFNLREQILGPGGANLQYIRNETKALASLRGRGSNFVDPILGTETNEPLYLYLEHQRFDGLQAAKQLAKNLIETLQQELIQFQQQQQQSAPSQSISMVQQPTIVQQQTLQNQQITISGQNSISQITVPPPQILATVPPPTVVQQHPTPQATTLVQTNQSAVLHQNYIQQLPPPSVPPPPQATVIHQQIIPQPATIPIQLQTANMIIQQPPPATAAVPNVNIPPPSSGALTLPMKTAGQIVQFQQPPPPSVAVATTSLTQPPPTQNVQLPNGQTQIILNPSQSYQYQYIQHQPIQTAPSSQPVTIQHIYQPQAVQQANQQLNFQQHLQFQPQAQIRQPFGSIQQPQMQQQQFIAVQGNTAYMVPPPQIVQQPPQQQQIIIQTQQPQMQQLMQIQQPPPPPTIAGPGSCNQQQQLPNSSTDVTENNGMVLEENDQHIEDDDNENKHDIKTEENDENEEKDIEKEQQQYNDSANIYSTATTTNTTNSVSVIPTIAIQQYQPQQQIQIRQGPMILPPTQIPPPPVVQPSQQLTATSLPISCVQHYMGNTLITTNPMLQMAPTQQIYTQVPVSIQTIQQPPQHLHVSTANGQQFVVSAQPAQQWQNSQDQQITQVQQIQPNGTIQNIQISHPPPGSVASASQSVTSQLQPLVVSQSTMGMVSSNPPQQVQYTPATNIIQHMQPPPQNQINSNLHLEQQQQQQTQILNQSQNIINVQQQQQLNIMQTSQGPTLTNNSFRQSSQMTPFQQLKSFSEQHQSRMMIGQKRKYNNNNDEGGPSSNHQSRMGIGKQQQMQQNNMQLINVTQPPPPPPPPVMQTSTGQSLSSTGGLNINGQDDLNSLKNQPNDQNQINDNRPFYQRDDGYNIDVPPPLPLQPQQLTRQKPPGYMMMIRNNVPPRFSNVSQNQNFQIRQQYGIQNTNFENGPPRMNFQMQQYRNNCPPGGQNFGSTQRFSRGGQW